MIKQTVNEFDFTRALMSDESAGWTYGATKALFDYYEELSESIGEDIELDSIAIRCEWNEYDNALEAVANHTFMIDHYQNELSEEENEQLAREWLEERTTVLDVENLDKDCIDYRIINSILVMSF